MPSATIICVTPNAALDRTVVVPDFAIGRIFRIDRGVVVPGGKGLNMMRAVKILGGHPLSMGLLGGHTGRMVAAMVAEADYAAQWTWFQGETRTCTIIAAADGNSTVINESGQIAPRDWHALAADISARAAADDVYAVCLCGSLPSGAPETAPAELIQELKQRGVKTWVDSSNLALRNAIAAKPFAIKVNRDELADALNIDGGDVDQLLRSAKELIAGGIQIVVISLGAEGAVLLSADLCAKATPPVIQPLDPIASGDCLHAGIVTALSQGCDVAEAIRRGVAAGTVNALYAGGAQFPRHHFRDILRGTRVETFAN